MKKLLLFLLLMYQKTAPLRMSLYTTLGIPYHSCRHSPTCSQYAAQVMSKYGTIRGVHLAIKRIWKCRPNTLFNDVLR